MVKKVERNSKTGRPKGAKSASTIAKQEAMDQAAQILREAIGSDMFEGDSLVLLSSIYKNQRMPLDVRIDCAKACLPFEHARLNQNTLTNGLGEELQVSIVRFTDAPLPEQTEKTIPLRH
ncbi:MAG: hypothetical protein L0287_37585 [Anaerolineae bacterium]|nr:hypothetical protein [Anaerolineae bacterium]